MERCSGFSPLSLSQCSVLCVPTTEIKHSQPAALNFAFASLQHRPDGHRQSVERGFSHIHTPHTAEKGKGGGGGGHGGRVLAECKWRGEGRVKGGRGGKLSQAQAAFPLDLGRQIISARSHQTGDVNFRLIINIPSALTRLLYQFA